MTQDPSRVLIVDDHRAIHDDFRKLLVAPPASRSSELARELFGGEPPQSSRFDVESAYQGEEGVAMVRQAVSDGRPFALAIVDMRMPPGWDGLRTVETMWASDPDLQVIICTAYSDTRWEDIQRRLGTSDGLLILKKPFDPAEACQAASALTEKWHLSKRARVSQAALRASEERWQLAFEGARDGLWDWNIATGDVYYSPRWEEMFGYEPGSAPRTLEAFAPLVHPDDVGAMFAEVHRYLRRETPTYSYEFRMRRLDGTPMWTRHRATARFDHTGQALRMVGTTTDTTDYKNIEAKLRDNEARAQATLAAMPDLLFRFDRRARFLDAQATDPTQLLMPPEAFLGRSAQDVLPEPIAAQVSQAIASALDDRGLQQFEYSLDLDGKPQCFEVRAVKVNANEVLALCRNISTAKQVGAELQASEQRLRITLDSIGDAVLVVDRHGRLTDVNPVAERLTGWSEREAKGREASEVIHLIDEQTGETAPLRIDELIATRHVRGQADRAALVARGGSARSVAESAAPLHDAQGRAVGAVLVFRDVTDERCARSTLLRSNAELEAAVSRRTAELSHAASTLRAAFEATADGLLVVDQQGKVTGTNQRFFQMWNIPDPTTTDDDALLRVAVDQLLDPEAFLRQVRELYADPGRESFDTLLLKDGRVFERYSRPQVLGDEVVGRVWSFRDVTDRARQSRELGERERLLSESQRVAGIGSWSVDLRAQTVSWTEQTYRIYGVSPEYVLTDTSVQALVHPEDRGTFRRHIVRLAQGGSDAIEFRIVQSDGSIRMLYGQGATVVDDAGAPARVVGTVQDVTPIRALEAQVRHAQKMEALGRLAGGIAHDFNNLLTVIMAAIEQALAGRGADDSMDASWEDARAAVERAAAMTQQLLAFSRKQVLQPVLLDLNALVTKMLSMLRRLIGEHIRVDFTPEIGVGLVKGDPGQLEQVVINLALNARDAMEAGGTLTIATREAVAGAATGQGAGQEPQVVLSVCDTGAGMDEATRRQAFEPFFTTKAPGKGTGLGLATVEGIVKQSGGRVEVRSTPGLGSTFEVYLPRANGEPAASVEPTVSAAGGAETVLVVEDEAGVRRVAVRILTKAGYRVLEAADGEEGLRILAQHDGRVHLLLTDVVMLGLSGPELAARAWALYPNLKVIFTSGHTGETIDRHPALGVAANFLGKPYSMAGLTGKVRAVLDA